MVRLWLAIISCSLLYTVPAHGQVGKKYREFRGTEFAKFFNVTTRSRKDLADGGTKIHLEPGGHKKAIDIQVRIDQGMTMLEARLLVDRSFIGDSKQLNPLAKDIAKSFLAHVSCDPNNAALKQAVDQIWNVDGTEDTVLKTAKASAAGEAAMAGGATDHLAVFLGTKERSVLTLEGCSVTLANDSDRFTITITQSKKP